MKRLTVGVLAGLLATSVAFAADDSRDGGGRAASGTAAEPTKPAGVPLPKVSIIKQGEKCVEPTDEMRRNHMNKILHQRDRTMHDGIRTNQHSLKNCVDCHADPKTNSVLGKDGFCESCHRYAAVSMDCFECHSSAPQKQAGDGKPTTSRQDLLLEQLQRVVAAPKQPAAAALAHGSAP